MPASSAPPVENVQRNSPPTIQRRGAISELVPLTSNAACAATCGISAARACRLRSRGDLLGATRARLSSGRRRPLPPAARRRSGASPTSSSAALDGSTTCTSASIGLPISRLSSARAVAASPSPGSRAAADRRRAPRARARRRRSPCRRRGGVRHGPGPRVPQPTPRRRRGGRPRRHDAARTSAVVTSASAAAASSVDVSAIVATQAGGCGCGRSLTPAVEQQLLDADARCERTRSDPGDSARRWRNCSRQTAAPTAAS